MTYTRKTLGATYTLELMPTAVRYTGRNIWSGSGESLFPLAELSPEPGCGITRRDTSVYTAVALVVALFGLLIYVFQTPSSSHSFFVDHQKTVTTIALVFIVAVSLIRPRVAYATFRWRSGPAAFSVIKSSGKHVEYETFVKSLEDAIRNASGANVTPNSPLQPTATAPPSS